MRRWLRHQRDTWGVGWIVAGIWLTSWAAYFVAEVVFDGSSETAPGWLVWLTGTFENQQSEAWFGVLEVFVITGLASRYFGKQREDHRELLERIDRLERVLLGEHEHHAV